MSTLQSPRPSSHWNQPTGTFSWDAPRLHKDKIHRSKGRPVTTLGPLLPSRVAPSPPGPPRVSLLDRRSKSGPNVLTLKSFSVRTSPTGSVDMSTSRFSLDARSLSGSVYSQSERPGLAQGLRAKGSRLMRRQNSKFNSQTIEWPEESDDRHELTHVQDSWTRGNPKNGRTQSAGNVYVDKLEISEPYNFQHLTHTHARHFQEIDRASNHDLVSEFSALRASQMPRRELKGIKAECLPSKVTQSEPVSPIRQDLYISPKSPIKPTSHHVPSPNSIHHHSNSSTDYFSQPQAQAISRPFKGPYLPTSPPIRSSSRAAVTTAPNFFTVYHENEAEQHSLQSTDVVSPSQSSTIDDSDRFLDFDFSALPHAVTTPDDTAFPLTPTNFRPPGGELADVPEEDEKAAAEPSRPSTPGSGLRHTKSFPTTRRNSQRWSCSPRTASTRDSNTIPNPLHYLCQSETLPPLVGESYDDVPDRPRLSRRISLKPQGFDGCWEKDIDYCYEHAAEADCDFDWDTVSVQDATTDTYPTTDAGPAEKPARSISEEYENISAMSLSTSASLPRLQTSLSGPPPLFSANSAKSSSIGSLATPATPSYPLPSPQPYGLSNRSFTSSTEAFHLNSSLPGYMENDSHPMSEEVYDNIFLSKHSPDDQLPLHSLRFGPPASVEVSPRSSRSPLSKCNSQESFMLSRSSSLRYPRSCDSFGSVPDLVHSKASRDKFDVSAEQLAELAATIKAAETSDVNLPLRQRSNQNLAKEVVRTSMLQKASSFNSVEEEDFEDSGIVMLPSPSHHERSQSTTVPQPHPTSTQRKRSVSSATALTKASRGSYSLFPPQSVRSPF